MFWCITIAAFYLHSFHSISWHVHQWFQCNKEQCLIEKNSQLFRFCWNNISQYHTLISYLHTSLQQCRLVFVVVHCKSEEINSYLLCNDKSCKRNLYFLQWFRLSICSKIFFFLKKEDQWRCQPRAKNINGSR